MAVRFQHLLDAAARRKYKVEQLVALLNDPELAEDVALLLGTSQDAATLAPVENGANASRDGLRGTIMSLESLPERFTSAQVIEVLEAVQYNFGTDPKAAVRDALYKLQSQNKVRIVQKGGGGILNVYERVAGEQNAS